MSQTKPFFVPQKEFDLINSMNEELIDEIVGQSVDVYKVNIDRTDENVYGESTTKYYDIGFRVKDCNDQLLASLEPWCNRIYSDADWKSYIEVEQANTKFNLAKRCHSLTGTDKNDYDDILVEIDGNNFNQRDFQYINSLAEILDNDEDLIEHIGDSFQLGNLKITINSLKTYEKELIICRS